jgi:outer membrane protein TolC
MLRNRGRRRTALAFLTLLVVTLPLAGRRAALGQELAPPPHPLQIPSCAPPVHFTPPAPTACDRPLPINLPTALQLAGARPLDIAVAAERIRLAAADLQRANVLWLPTVYLGVDYYRHDGQLQDVAGNIFGTSKSALLFGAGPSAVFAVTDALFEPLAARQVLRARESTLQTARNDSLLAVAEAYFNVQQARGELAGAEDAARKAEEVVRKVEPLVRYATPVEVTRARAEAARRRQLVTAFRERWRTASADLARLLRLDAAALVEPLEPPHLRVTLVPPARSVDDLIAVGLTNRPELATEQALVQATLQRLRQERLRPFIPSVLLRGAATNPAGLLAGGAFGGGIDGRIGNFSARGDFDVEVLWEWKNLGLGNLAQVRARRAENRLAVLELFRVQDRVAAEVAQAHAQVVSAAARVEDAESGLRYAAESAVKNIEGMSNTVPAGERLILVIRPQEVVASIQALGQAYSDYYGAVADYDRAQFRLYRALGQPAQEVTGESAPCPGGPVNAPPRCGAVLGRPLIEAPVGDDGAGVGRMPPGNP